MNSSISKKNIVLAFPSAALSGSQSGASPRDATKLDDLARAAALGDRQAIGTLAATYGPKLLAIARRHAGPEDAEDAVQDLYLSLVEGRAARFPPAEGRGLAWLGGLVRSLARSRSRGGP
jgi:DNA-directed RNA polymerase specialized sigma24 family protein